MINIYNGIQNSGSRTHGNNVSNMTFDIAELTNSNNSMSHCMRFINIFLPFLHHKHRHKVDVLKINPDFFALFNLKLVKN